MSCLVASRRCRGRVPSSRSRGSCRGALRTAGSSPPGRRRWQRRCRARRSRNPSTRYATRAAIPRSPVTPATRPDWMSWSQMIRCAPRRRPTSSGAASESNGRLSIIATSARCRRMGVAVRVAVRVGDVVSSMLQCGGEVDHEGVTGEVVENGSRHQPSRLSNSAGSRLGRPSMELTVHQMNRASLVKVASST